MTHCPAHADRSPSLSIATANGKVLANCFAGCSQEAVWTALESRGLRRAPNRPSRGTHSRGPQTSYSIRDLDGNEVAVHVRVDRPGQPKKMFWEPKGVRTAALPLYGTERLPALHDGAAVVVTEGEKARDAVLSLGIAAVGTVCGASVTPTSEVLRPLARLAVYLWPDNDGEGRRHMELIARQLAWMGARVATIHWPPAQAKDDAADFVEAGGTPAGLQALITEAVAIRCDGLPGSNPVEMLERVRAFVRQYVVLTAPQLDAVALWVAHTWALEAFEMTPYLEVHSAEKRSGKSRLLEVLSLLVATPWLTGRVTAAVLVRRVARDQPTMLLDESDAMFKGEKEFVETLRGILNAGHRRGGTSSMCVKSGEDFELRDFPVFGAKAIAGIGRLPDTIRDRSISIEMRRRAPDEEVTRLRRRDAEAAAEPIAMELARWAVTAAPALRDARPEIPCWLDDRAADGWEPLLAIADSVGGEWPDRARRAALALSAGDSREDTSRGIQILADIRAIFTGIGADRIPSATLAGRLAKLEDRPWGDLRGRPIDNRALSALLKPYGVKPSTIRLPDQTTPRGYLKEWFADPWARYLTPEAPQQPQHAQQRLNSDSSLVAAVAAVAPHPIGSGAGAGGECHHGGTHELITDDRGSYCGRCFSRFPDQP